MSKPSQAFSDFLKGAAAGTAAPDSSVTGTTGRGQVVLGAGQAPKGYGEANKSQAFTAGFAGFLSNVARAAQTYGADTGDYADKQARIAAEATARNSAPQSFEDVKSLGDFGGYAANLAAGSLPEMGAAAAGGLVGFLSPVPGGAALGAGAVLTASGVGQATQAQIEQTGTYDPFVSTVAGGAYGVLGATVGPTAALARMGLKAAGTGIVQGAKVGALKGLATEPIQEVGQTLATDILPRTTDSSYDLLGADALGRAKEAAIGGLVLGGPLGGVTGAIEGRARPTDPSTTPPAPIEPDMPPARVSSGAGLDVKTLIERKTGLAAPREVIQAGEQYDLFGTPVGAAFTPAEASEAQPAASVFNPNQGALYLGDVGPGQEARTAEALAPFQRNPPAIGAKELIETTTGVGAPPADISQAGMRKRLDAPIVNMFTDEPMGTWGDVYAQIADDISPDNPLTLQGSPVDTRPVPNGAPTQRATSGAGQRDIFSGKVYPPQAAAPAEQSDPQFTDLSTQDMFNGQQQAAESQAFKQNLYGLFQVAGFKKPEQTASFYRAAKANTPAEAAALIRAEMSRPENTKGRRYDMLERIAVEIEDAAGIDETGQSVSQLAPPVPADTIAEAEPITPPTPVENLNAAKPKDRPALPEVLPKVGPGAGGAKPTPIGKPVFSEMDSVSLYGLLVDNATGGYARLFTADNPDIAIGQGSNTGIFVRFRGEAVSGKENPKPATGDIAGREYVTDYIGADAIDSVRILTAKKLEPATLRKLKAAFTPMVEGKYTTWTAKSLERSNAPQPAPEPGPVASAEAPAQVEPVQQAGVPAPASNPARPKRGRKATTAEPAPVAGEAVRAVPVPSEPKPALTPERKPQSALEVAKNKRTAAAAAALEAGAPAEQVQRILQVTQRNVNDIRNAARRLEALAADAKATPAAKTAEPAQVEKAKPKLQAKEVGYDESPKPVDTASTKKEDEFNASAERNKESVRWDDLSADLQEKAVLADLPYNKVVIRYKAEQIRLARARKLFPSDNAALIDAAPTSTEPTSPMADPIARADLEPVAPVTTSPAEDVGEALREISEAQPEAQELPEPVVFPEWALTGNDVTRELVWVDGDLALYRAIAALSGDILYVGGIKNGSNALITRVDVGIFSGKQATKAQIKTLQATADLFRAQDKALADANPDGPFVEGAVVVAGSLPGEFQNYAKALIELLNLNTKVFVFGSNDKADPHFVDRYKLYGKYARAKSAGVDSGENGSTRRMADGSHYIFISDDLNTAEQIETLAHEVGHIVEKEALKNASPEERAAIKREYEAWRAAMKGVTRATLLGSLRNKATADADIARIGDAGQKSADELSSYWTSFSEWFADNVSRWATTSKKPASLIDRFFAGVARKLATLWGWMNDNRITASPSVAAFLDRMVSDGPVDFSPEQSLKADNSVVDGANQSRSMASERAGATANTDGVANNPEGKVFKAVASAVDKALGPNTAGVYTATMRDKFVRAGLGILTNDQIVSIFNKIYDGAKSGAATVKDLIDRMNRQEQDKNAIVAASDKIFRKMSAVLSEFKAEGEAMVKLAYEATYKQIDPSMPLEQQPWLLKVRKDAEGNTIKDEDGKPVRFVPDETRRDYEDMSARYQEMAKNKDVLNVYDGVFLHAKELRQQIVEELIGQSDRNFGVELAKVLGDSEQLVRAQTLLKQQQRTKYDTKDYKKVRAEINELASELTDAGASILSRYADAVGDILSQDSQLKGPYLPLMRRGDYIYVYRSEDLVKAHDELKALNDRVRDAAQADTAEAAARKARTTLNEANAAAKKAAQKLRARPNSTPAKEAVAEANKAVQAARDALAAALDANRKSPYRELRREQAELRKRVQAMEADGDKYEVVMSDSEVEVKRLEAERGGFSIRREEMNELSRIDQGFASRIGLEATKDLNTEDAAVVRALTNGLYLQLSPQNSYLKRQIQRGNVKGFSEDLKQNFMEHTRTVANLISKVRHSGEIFETLESLKADTTGPQDVREAKRAVYNEMKRRSNMTMSAAPTPIQNFLTQMGALFYLGVTPAFPLLNATQGALVTYPMLAAKFGAKKAGQAMIAALKDSWNIYQPKNLFGKGALSYEVDPTGAEVNLTPGEKAMLANLQSLGRLNFSQVVELTDSSGMPKFDAVNRFAWHLPHHTEVMNRLYSALAAYRLATDAGQTQAEAEQTAIDIVTDSHGNYNPDNKPRYFRQVYKPLTLFKSFAQMMAYATLRNAWLSVKGGSAAEKRTARFTLAYMAGMHQLIAGAVGVPGMGLLGAVANMFAGDDDEPWEYKTEMRAGLKETFGETLGDVLYGGVFRLTPFDIGSRVGSADILTLGIRLEGDPGKTGGDELVNQVFNLLGPVGSIGKGVADGSAKLEDAQTFKEYMEGIGMMMPKAVGDVIKAINNGTYGEENRRGVQLQEFNGIEIASQLIGLTPTDRTRAAEIRTSRYKYKTELKERRNKILQKYAKAALRGDQELMDELKAEAEAYSEANPNNKIAPYALRSAVRRLQEQQESVTDGYVNEERDADLPTE